MAKKKLKTGVPAKLYEFNGESKSAYDWAKEIGITHSAFRERWRKFENNVIPLADVFAVNTPAPAKSNDLAQAKELKGVRTRATAALFAGFEKHLLPHLDAELIEYRATKKRGPAMEFYLAYKDYFPKDKSELLDGDTSGTPVATVAVVIQNNAAQPQNITIIDQ